MTLFYVDSVDWYELQKEKDTNMETTETIQEIPLTLIDAPAWDSRLIETEKDETLQELADALRESGQLQPIIVEGPTAEDRYVRVFGGRRQAAASLLGWTSIKAIVRPSTDDTRRIVDNATENMKRKDLTSYEQARTFAKLREVGMSGDDIGAKFGLSKSRVQNLVVPLAKLPDPILEDWKNNVPAVDTKELRRISALKDSDEMIRQWEARKKDYEARTNPETGKVKRKKSPKGKGKGGSNSVSLKQAHYHIVEEFLRDKKTPATLGKAKVPKKWAYVFMCYLVGAADVPPDGIDPTWGTGEE